MDDRILSAGEAAKLLGVSLSTLRRLVEAGQVPCFRMASGHRRFRLSQVRPDLIKINEAARRTIGYARVCSQAWRPNLEAQEVLISEYCNGAGLAHEQLSDVAAGFNNYRSGFRFMLSEVLAGRVERVVITHRERLGRFGGEIFLSVCAASGVQVVILNAGPTDDLSDDLNADLADAGALFASDFFGMRSARIADLVRELASKAGMEDG